jgi:hypothetical protein
LGDARKRVLDMQQQIDTAIAEQNNLF